TTDAALPTRNLAYFDSLERAARATVIAARLPGDWETRTDLPEVLGLPFEAALHAAGADPQTTSDLYREFHLRGARATLAFVLSRAGARGGACPPARGDASARWARPPQRWRYPSRR